MLDDLGVDAEGFTPGLQELSLLAGVLEPYETASAELLRRFAEVAVSAEKIQTLVRQEGSRLVVRGLAGETLRLTDVNGAVVLKTRIPRSGLCTVDLGKMVPGMYILGVDGDGKRASSRIVVE